MRPAGDLDQWRRRAGFRIGFVKASKARIAVGRTCCTRLKCEGTYSRTSRSWAPIRPNFVPPQVGQTQGASCTVVSIGR